MCHRHRPDNLINSDVVSEAGVVVSLHTGGATFACIVGLKPTWFATNPCFPPSPPRFPSNKMVPQPLEPPRAPPKQKSWCPGGTNAHPAKKRGPGEGMFPATPHPNKKFVRQMIEWAKKKDTWRDTIRPNFRRRPQEPPSALGFARVCRRYFDILGGAVGVTGRIFGKKYRRA